MANTPDPRSVGPYELAEPIATGTTATVWRGRDTRTGAEVAVKRFHPHLFADRTARKRMHDEAKAARGVHGRTIVSAIDRISTRDEFALVFPFVVGTPLAERLRESPPLTDQQAAAVAADVAEALAAIHRAGFVHRDVKPGNVLLADDGRALLLDFGISRTVANEIELEHALTGAGLAIGTLPYMAPEQLAANKISSATDVYALGVLMYEMLAGQRPYAAGSPVALATEQRVPPARIDNAPPPLVDLALRAMSFDPGNRPTAAQLAETLRAWLAAPLAVDAPTAPLAAVTPAMAAAAAPPAFTPPPPQRRRAALTAAVAVAGVLVVALVALAAIAPGAAPSGTQPSAAPVAFVDPSVSPAAAPSPTPVPAAPAAPVNPQPTKPPATQANPTPTPPPAAPSPAPKHHGHHHHGHGHGHKHHKHH